MISSVVVSQAEPFSQEISYEDADDHAQRRDGTALDPLLLVR